MLTFYMAPGSSSMAVHIALHETGAPFETHPMSFATKDMQKPEFRTINPNGKVPTLLIDGRALPEVAGILFYLARALSGGQSCCRSTIPKPRHRSSRGCRSSRRPFIRRARPAWSERARSRQIADTRLGAERMGGRRPLFDRRHPSLPPLLANSRRTRAASPATSPTSRRITSA